MSEYKELSCLAYDLRKKVVEMVVSGKGGHIGGDMSVIDVLVALYFKEMNISPENMDDPDRDRFVMSKGHSVEAYYAVLVENGKLTGYMNNRETAGHFGVEPCGNARAREFSDEPLIRMRNTLVLPGNDCLVCNHSCHI